MEIPRAAGAVPLTFLSTTLALAVVMVALTLRSRTSAPVVRGLLAGLATAVVLAAPALTQVVIEQRLREMMGRGWFVDPSPLVYWAPALVTVLLAGAAFARERLPLRPPVRGHLSAGRAADTVTR